MDTFKADARRDSSRPRTWATCCANIQLPDSASLERTKEIMDRCERIAARRRPGIRLHTQAVTGQSLLLSANGSNFGSMFCILDPFDEADVPRTCIARTVIADASKKRFGKQVPEAMCDGPRAAPDSRASDVPAVSS